MSHLDQNFTRPNADFALESATNIFAALPDDVKKTHQEEIILILEFLQAAQNTTPPPSSVW